MPDEVTVIVETGDEDMALDLAENVGGMLLKSGSEAHQALMTDIMHNGANVHNLTRLSSFKHFDEFGIEESRANSGLIATPIATPTTQ